MASQLWARTPFAGCDKGQNAPQSVLLWVPTWFSRLKFLFQKTDNHKALKFISGARGTLQWSPQYNLQGVRELGFRPWLPPPRNCAVLRGNRFSGTPDELSTCRLKSPKAAGARWRQKTRGNYKGKYDRAAGCCGQVTATQSMNSQMHEQGGHVNCACSIISRLWGPRVT